MEYYILEEASDTNETGSAYPQVAGMSPGYDFSAPNSIHRLNGDRLPDFEPALDRIMLDKEARLTDVVSTVLSAFGFLASHRLKLLLERFRMPLHKFHTSKIEHRGKIRDDYFWFHPVGNLSKYVDYEKTAFFARDDFNNRERLLISSLKEIDEHRPTLGHTKRIVCERLIFVDNYKIDLDLFEIGGFDFRTYVSPKLRDKLISDKITGIELTPVNFI